MDNSELLKRIGSAGARSLNDSPTQQSGTERRRQIFRASVSGISTWRGIASTAPVLGFVHNE